LSAHVNLTLCCRYTVVLIGRKTIYDAFVRKGVAFGDRMPFAAEKVIGNERRIGNLILFHISLVNDQLCLSIGRAAFEI
jgi:hypothetical protein